jgi:hypothetical protein
MARPRAALPPTPEEQLLAEAADLAARIEATQARLRAALLAGDGTGGIRGELVQLQGQADAVCVELIRISDERLEQVNKEIEAVAQAMADGLAVRLAALVAGLQPPPLPTWV